MCKISPFHKARLMQPKMNSQNMRRRKKGVELIFFFSSLSIITPKPYPKRIENKHMNLFSIKMSCSSFKKLSKCVACASIIFCGTLLVSMLEKFPSSTPNSAKPRNTSTTTMRSFCCMGSGLGN